jgi:uncharacterized protein involved in type VI secretion and phage assembly
MRRIPGVVIGIVKDLDDPEEQGRIRVEFPWLSEEQRSNWAPIAVPMAGRERGMYFMPELEDEVLVAFDHGDFNHPFVVGFLWNGVDTPPDDGIDASVRRLRTVTGHVLEFDDRDGKERILLKSQGGNEIEVVDSPTATITIKTSAGNEIAIGDSPPSITVTTNSGTVEVNCVQAKVNAKSMLSVSAPLADFSGVVKVPTLVAQTVIGSSYTPAPGNTYGY